MNNSDSIIDYLLPKIGKEVFLKILYPEILRDSNVTIEELANKYTRYASFSITSQRSRLSNSKKIFELNKQKEALLNIMPSKKVSKENKELARKYYKEI